MSDHLRIRISEAVDGGSECELTDWEQNFLNSVSEKASKPGLFALTDRQEEVLRSIESKIERQRRG